MKNFLLQTRLTFLHKDIPTFEDKVIDIKIKRKMLELNKNDALLNFSTGNYTIKLKDEMNPKILPLSFLFYSDPKFLLTSLLKNILLSD